MSGRWQSCIALSVTLSTLAPLAMAEEPVVSSNATAAASVAGRPALLPAPPPLQLSWPAAPLAFSFRSYEQGNYGARPLSSFRAEALWLRQGRLSLVSISRAERAFELACFSTCQPQLERAVSVEARLQLASGAVIREAHAFAGYEMNWSGTSQNKKRALMRFGLAGTFD
jgi:hypothetical protein